MMFGATASPNEFVLLDWQLCSMGLCTQDLQYFVSGNLRKDAIAANTETILDTYYEALRGAGVADYSREQLETDYAQASLFLGLYLVTGLANLDPTAYNERGNDLIETMFGTLADSMLRYEAERFLPA
jgi:hypothetical protein